MHVAVTIVIPFVKSYVQKIVFIPLLPAPSSYKLSASSYKMFEIFMPDSWKEYIVGTVNLIKTSLGKLRALKEDVLQLFCSMVLMSNAF